MNSTIKLLPLLLLVVTNLFFTSNIINAEQCCASTESKKIIELPESAIKNLEINAGFGWGIFSGSIYNHNKDYHVNQLTISMIPIPGHGHGEHHHDHQATANEPRMHTITINLPPDSKGAISMPLPDGDLHVHSFDWKIVKASGYLK